jgi:hypothetical protein
MTTTTPAPLVRLHWHHPEWPAVAVSALGWLALLGQAATEPALLFRADHHHAAPASVLGHSIAMTAAMMTPLVLRHVHDLAVASLGRRRYRAVVEYLGGYLLTWTALGAVTMVGLHLMSARTGPGWLVVVTCMVAIVVVGNDAHLRRLRRCHAGRPLALTGWRADRDCLVDGVRMAGRCVATTWAVMLAVMAQGGLLVLAAGTVYVVAERRGLLRDRTLVRWTATLGAVAVLLTMSFRPLSGADDGPLPPPHHHQH